MVNYDYDYASKQRMQLGRVCVQVLGHLSDAPYLELPPTSGDHLDAYAVLCLHTVFNTQTI